MQLLSFTFLLVLTMSTSKSPAQIPLAFAISALSIASDSDSLSKSESEPEHHAPISLLSRIQNAAAHDSIPLTILPFYREALQSIIDVALHPTLSTSSTSKNLGFSKATRIDTHTHPIPSWFRTLEPEAAGRATPEWSIDAHLKFMAEHDIAHSVLCPSTPMANAFLFTDQDDAEVRKNKTIALARLLNEFSAAVSRAYPQRFSWMAVLPLPYGNAAVKEAHYAMQALGAVGVGILTNHEGLYPGEGEFEPLWEWLQERAVQGIGAMGKRGDEKDGYRKEVVFVHPTEPVIKFEDGKFVRSRPCMLLRFLLYFTIRVISIFASVYRTDFDTQSPPSLRPRRILLRNGARHLQHHFLRHLVQISESPLAHLARRGRLPRHIRALLARLPRTCRRRENSVQGALLV